MQQAEPTFSQPIKGCSREDLALKIQSEAKRLHVQPALGVHGQSGGKPEQTTAPRTQQDKDAEGFQQVSRKKTKKPKEAKQTDKPSVQLPK
eukprot:2422415-Amphidinium_carterae.1